MAACRVKNLLRARMMSDFGALLEAPCAASRANPRMDILWGYISLGGQNITREVTNWQHLLVLVNPPR